MTAVRYSIAASAPSGGDTGAPVEPPPLVQQPINLVRSSRNPADGTLRWTNGFSYLPASNGELVVADDCGPDAENVPVTRKVGPIFWKPYILRADFECSLMGFNEQGNQDRVRNLLDIATPKMIEFEFWNGVLAQAAGWDNLYLANNSEADTYTASSMNEAIGICEQYISEVGPGGRGMIHAAPFLTPYLQMICRREGNLLLTYRDTIIVPGSGYGIAPGTTGKPPQPSGPFHLYATGITDVRVTEIFPVPDNSQFGMAVDRATNTVVLSAMRYAVASWDGVVFADVSLNLTL